MTTVTQTVPKGAQPQQPLVVVLKNPENNQEQATGSWINTAIGVAVVAGVLYGAYQFRAFEDIPSSGGITDWVKGQIDSSLFQLGKYAGVIYLSKEVATNAGPKVADALVATGGKVANKSAEYFPTFFGYAVNGIAKVGGLSARFVASMLPLGNRIYGSGR